MAKTLDPVMLTIAVRTARDILKEEAQARPSGGNSYDELLAEQRVIRDRLNDWGFTVKDNFTEWSVAYGNVRSTSTTGVHGATYNWITAVERKIGEVTG